MVCDGQLAGGCCACEEGLEEDLRVGAREEVEEGGEGGAVGGGRVLDKTLES